MLVLTRKRNEQIRIGDNITLTVLRIKGNTVRLGVEAPRQVRVLRGELPPKKTASNALEEQVETAYSVVDPLDELDEVSDKSMSPAPGPDAGRLSQLVRQVRRSNGPVASAV